MHIDSIKNDFNLKDVSFRAAQPKDGLALWQLVRDTGVLDLNSPYFYVLMATDFGQTCLVVEHDQQLVGAIIGHHPPKEKNTTFCWQIAVHPTFQGQQLGLHMLDRWLALPANRSCQWVTATVATDNEPSHKLFTRFAANNNAPCEWAPHFEANQFPDGHAAEPMVRIGPIVFSGVTV
jgi:L-2,4-diaminobutyric acid acetyltransferase